jgi:formylglycine-generating enzyme required for sulfatase activity
VRAKQTTRVAVALDRIPTPEAGRVWKIPDLELVMQPISAGSFAMGDDKVAKTGRETMTPVTINRAFWLGRTEVTQREWLAIMEVNPSRFMGDDLPVERVSWEAALDFCRRLTARERAAGRLPEGYAYSLPTEEQWEYACRAGTTGEFAGDVDAMAWHAANSGRQTQPVGLKQANAWGLCDLHGNVMEWCLGRPAERDGSGVSDASGRATDQSLVCPRGGSIFNEAGGCRSGFRPKNPAVFIGVRVALNAGP